MAYLSNRDTGDEAPSPADLSDDGTFTVPEAQPQRVWRPQDVYHGHDTGHTKMRGRQPDARLCGMSAVQR
jgi:hypothetical protein